MTPADGTDFRPAHDEIADLGGSHAILLRGGRTLLLFETAGTPPPRAGLLVQNSGRAPWTAESWPVGAESGRGWCGVAILESMPAAGAEIRDPHGVPRWRLGPPPRLDIGPEPLLALVRRAEVSRQEIHDFLARHLVAGQQEDAAETRSNRDFLRGFLTTAAERDGFVEVIATPDTGGFFAQGWSMSLAPGASVLEDVAGELSAREVEVALFDRDDILPPGRGFCLFGKFWQERPLHALDALFFEANGRLLRLDVAPGSMHRLTDAAATTHVGQMLPRLRADDATLAAFRRICRPRFGGIDTLAECPLPLAAGFDAVLRAPDGTLLVLGWLLDPLRRAERVLLKSTGNLYGRLDTGWSPLPRPDLLTGFAGDPRFANLLDRRDVMHGFVAHVPGLVEQTDGAEVYLELVLDDGNCLYRPLAVTPFDGAERLPQLLGLLSPTEPELARIVEDHLAPFLTSVRPTSPKRGPARPISLGPDAAAREVTAIVPFARLAELQPMLALLAGAPEAPLLDLTLVTTRAVASDAMAGLTDAFRFYGLRGRLVVSTEQDTLAGQLDAGLAAAGGARVLFWTPAALPKRPGWLPMLIAEAEAVGGPALLSPALTYEDGSIYYGGESSGDRGRCALSGYGADRLHRGAPKAAATGAAEIGLVDRATLLRAGGFAGQLFSDAFAHVDLADRLRRAGCATLCSGAVEFWMLDAVQATDTAPLARLLQQVDGALLDRRGRPGPNIDSGRAGEIAA